MFLLKFRCVSETWGKCPAGSNSRLEIIWLFRPASTPTNREILYWESSLSKLSTRQSCKSVRFLLITLFHLYLEGLFFSFQIIFHPGLKHILCDICIFENFSVSQSLATNYVYFCNLLKLQLGYQINKLFPNQLSYLSDLLVAYIGLWLRQNSDLCVKNKKPPSDSSFKVSDFPERLKTDLKIMKFFWIVVCSNESTWETLYLCTNLPEIFSRESSPF